MPIHPVQTRGVIPLRLAPDVLTPRQADVGVVFAADGALDDGPEVGVALAGQQHAGGQLEELRAGGDGGAAVAVLAHRVEVRETGAERDGQQSQRRVLPQTVEHVAHPTGGGAGRVSGEGRRRDGGGCVRGTTFDSSFTQ